MNREEFKRLHHCIRSIRRGVGKVHPLPFGDQPASSEDRVDIFVELEWLLKTRYPVVYPALSVYLKRRFGFSPPTTRVDMKLNMRLTREDCEDHRIANHIKP